MSSSFENLKNHIKNLSTSDDFFLAKKEWRLSRIEIQGDFEHCPCGQKIK